MRTIRHLLVFAVVVTLSPPSVACAQNFYAAVRGGPGWTPDVSIGLVGGQDPVSFTTGFTGSGAVGYAAASGLRVEGEFGYLYAPVSREEGASISGSIKDYLAMANLYYDLKTPAFGPFKPYIGFGIGGARVNEDRQTVFTTTGARVSIDEWRTAFAYQGRVGIGYDVNKWLDLSAGYRYVHINGGDRTNNGFVIRSDGIDNHSLELGAAFKF
jgi:opacity protein-like surface antigen